MKKTKKEIEVFRITPVVGKCYETAENTRKEGSWPNEKILYNKYTKICWKIY